MFANRKPVEIRDNGTLEAIKREQSFKEYHDEEKVETAPETQVLDKDACPKCGRTVRQGKYQHFKHCRGDK